MQSCFSLIASASAAAPRLRPLQLLLAAYVRFSCFSRSRPLRLLLPDCVHFNCCSPIVSASTAAHPIASASTAAPRLRPLQLLLPDCVRFNCCSPIASASTAARARFDCSSPIAYIHLPLAGFHPMPGSNVLEHSSRSSRFSK